MNYSESVWEKLQSKFVKKYLPHIGEGDTMATQAVTAMCRLVYRFYNDGDIITNQYGLDCTNVDNGLHNYANWLYKNVPELEECFMEIEDIESVAGYERYLYKLARLLYNDDLLEELNDHPKKDTIYKCKGPFKFEEKDEDD